MKNINWYNINFLNCLYNFLNKNYINLPELSLLKSRINLLEKVLLKFDLENINNTNFTFDYKSEKFYRDLIKKNISNISIERSSLTIIILTYNEERCIERCLKSCLNLANEIIIIDTGSTDNTLNIIKKFNSKKIKLFKIKWNNDFSEARNIGIEKASGDWILFIDSDEYFNENSINILNSIISLFDNYPQKENLVLSPTIVNQNSHILLGVNRLFFNTPNLRFFGKIHEEIRNLETQKTISLYNVNLIIHHDGYNNEIIRQKNKVNRNISLLREMISLEPNNIRWKLFLIRDGMAVLPTTYIENTLNNIIEICKNNTQDKLYKTYLEVAYKYLIEFFIYTNKFDKMENLPQVLYNLDNNINNFTYYKNIYEIYKIKSKLKNLILNTIKIQKENLSFYSDLHSSKSHLDFILAILLNLNGNFDKSMEFFEISKDNFYNDCIVKSFIKKF